MLCAPIAWGEQGLPQLIAQIASFDQDHAVSLCATNNGVDLILVHDAHAAREHDQGQFPSLASDEPAHIIHFASGPAMAKQSGARTFTQEQQVVAYFLTVIATEWSTFVPQMPIAYSRPPPGEMTILSVHRSTLLLI